MHIKLSSEKRLVLSILITMKNNKIKSKLLVMAYTIWPNYFSIFTLSSLPCSIFPINFWHFFFCFITLKLIPIRGLVCIFCFCGFFFSHMPGNFLSLMTPYFSGSISNIMFSFPVHLIELHALHSSPFMLYVILLFFSLSSSL